MSEDTGAEIPIQTEAEQITTKSSFKDRIKSHFKKTEVTDEEVEVMREVDATIQYVKGYDEKEKKWWTQIITDDDKRINSPYNTYFVPGLPPGPIANPGIEAIKAALNPQDTPYLYYLHAAGKIYPAKTLQEHNANIKKHL